MTESERKAIQGKKKIPGIILPFQRFIKAQAFSGILLLFFTIIALLWANSGVRESYFDLWHTVVSFGINGYMAEGSLHFLINDGLMAVFFLVVGLEIKREIIAGELSVLKVAALPIVAALGGMVAPAVIYFSLNAGTAYTHGWGIPTATDIAFAIGVMSLLGSRISLKLKVFLTALAIVDDMGAVIVIAFFYSSNLALNWLLLAIGLFMFQMLMNYLKVYRISVYIIPGILLWYALLKAGIHPTIGGVLTAMAMPGLNRIEGETMFEYIRRYLNDFESSFRAREHPLANQREQEGIYAIERTCRYAQTPLKRLEDKLHPWVTYFIMPVFALANAGVTFKGDIMSELSDSVTLGVMAGLLIGKPVGITLFSYISVKLGIAKLPEGEGWSRILGIGMLAGIGFTMSIFIANLAFKEAYLIDYAKTGILFASLASGILGFLYLMMVNGRKASTDD